VRRALLALALLVTAAGAQTTDAGGTLRFDTEWSGEILLLEDVVVPRGVTLKIAPGTRIIPDPKARGRGPGWNADRLEIHVAGRIVARGRREEPILFGAPAAGQQLGEGERTWLGVVLLPRRAKTSRFDWCCFENADAGLQVAGRATRLENCVIRRCTTGLASVLRSDARTLGVRYIDESAPVLRSCVFFDCIVGACAEAEARPDFEQCIFIDCGIGVGRGGFGRIYHPLNGVGPRIERCEFLRCGLGVSGSSRVTNSIFEANGMVFRPSGSHSAYTLTIDRYIRSHNLYSGNQTTALGEVPLGAAAVHERPRRKGELPDKERFDALRFLCDGPQTLLALQPASPGMGAGQGGSDIGAFGRRRGAVISGGGQAKAPDGLVVDRWMQCGPPGTPAATGAKWKGPFPKPGQVVGNSLWVAVRRADRPVRTPGYELLGGQPAPRTLVAILDCDTEGTKAELAIELDGRLRAMWNGTPILEHSLDDSQFGSEHKCSVVFRKGRNILTLIATPTRRLARLRARFVTPQGHAPGGVECFVPERKARKLRVRSLKWDREAGRSVLEVRFSQPVHWEDVCSLENYRTLPQRATPIPLKARRIEYVAKRNAVLIHDFKLEGPGRQKIVIADVRDANGVRREVTVPRSVVILRRDPR